MRTDVKYGIVAGLVVLLAVLIYVLVSLAGGGGDQPDRVAGANEPNEATERTVLRRPEPSAGSETEGDQDPEEDPLAAYGLEPSDLVPEAETEAPTPDAEAPTPGDDTLTPLLEPSIDEGPAVVLDPETETPGDEEPFTAEPEGSGERVIAPDLDPMLDDPAAGTDEGTGDVAMRLEPDPIDESISIRPVSVVPEGDDGGTLVPGMMEGPSGGVETADGPEAGEGPLPAGWEYYRVSDGDVLWTIARDHYGHSKYWELISRANPQIGAENIIRPGMVLKLPPKPSDASAGGAIPAAPGEGTAAAAGGTITGSRGEQRVYVVKEGDNGFWGIAAKPEVYGHGKHFTLIEKANPGVNPTALRPGQKLNIPPLPDASPAGAAVAEVEDAIGPAGAPRGPGGVYVVQSGDNGLGVIARKLYGQSSLWPALKQANPGIDSTRLQVGQKLKAPTKREALRMLGRDEEARETPHGRPVAPPAEGPPEGPTELIPSI